MLIFKLLNKLSSSTPQSGLISFISHKVDAHFDSRVVPIGEASVIIAVSSAHRKNSLEATQYCIDNLKATVPIWKKVVTYIFSLDL